MTLLRLGVRQQTIGLLAMGGVGAVSGVLNALAFIEIAGSTPQARAAFAGQMELLGAQLSYMLPLPVRVDTLAGYLQWRHFGSVALAYGVWAVISAAGSGRGDEERGLVEGWLAAGVGRARYLAARALVFVAVAATAIAAMVAATLIAGVAGGEPLSAAGMVAMGVDLLLLTVCCFGIGLVVAQLVTTGRNAAGIAVALTLGLYLINGASRTADVGAIRHVSPFYLFERSRPLTSGGVLDGGSVAVLAGAAIALVVLAVAAFVRRDLGGSALRRPVGSGPPARTPSRDPLLGVPVLALLRQQRLGIASWIVGLIALSAFLMSITKTIVDSLTSSAVPFLRAYFERAGLTAYDAFVGVIWLSTAGLLLSLYAITQVSTWSADDAEGRLATILSAPVSRGRVVVERVASMLVAAALIAGASGVAVYLVARTQSIQLDAGRVALATGLILAIPFSFGAIGQLVAVSRPRAAVIALSAVAVESYFVQQFAPLFQWPDWTKNLSLYALYGTPMSGDVGWGAIATLVAIGVAATAVALVAVRRRDVGA
jgi:ABC-2 type transport system permease protein